MDRRRFLSLLGACGFASAAGAVSAGPVRRPNIVLIHIDDLGWRDTGYTGGGFYETPAIDRLAREGMVFTRAYANAPNCAPSRACLMSGQYTPRHGVYTVGSPERGRSRDRKLIPAPNNTVLPDHCATIADVLRQAGYATGHFGKWHLGEGPETGPEGRGFDINVGGFRAGHPRSYFSPYRNPYLEDGPEGEYLTDRLTDEALRFIDQNRNRPFFAYLSHYAVHTPLQAKEAMVRKYESKPPDGGRNNPVYAAMIESVDRGVARILERLDRLGLSEDTVVIFHSDNGGHGVITSNEPLRGSKGMLYEGGVRVPMAVRWPGIVEPGGRCSEPVIGVDWFPTLTEIAGGARPDQPLDGVSLMPLFQGGNRLDREALYWHFPAYLEAYRRDEIWRTTPAGAIRAGDFKLIEFFEDGRLELYHLGDDPSESRNLAAAMPAKRDALRRRMREWRRSVNAFVPEEPNPEYQPRSEDR